MMYRFQKPLSIVTVLLCAGFFLNAALDGYRPSVCANDIACSAGFIRTVDRLITSIGASSEPTEIKRKKLGEQVADYIASRMPSIASNQPRLISRNTSSSIYDLPTIYVITPTYRRPEQIPDLVRLAQTLLHVPTLHWIVVEDDNKTTAAVGDLLQRYGMSHTHLHAPMPEKYKTRKPMPRGVSNRNAAMDWIRRHATSGVVYFADDDNTYDVRLFEEMRHTRKISMWPVGLVTKTALSSPVVDGRGRVVDFFDGWISKRKFPVDMAGFALSVQLINEKTDAYMPYRPGYEEDVFLQQFDISLDDIEPRADLCTKIFVWHTQTKKNGNADRELAESARYNDTNIQVLQSLLV